MERPTPSSVFDSLDPLKDSDFYTTRAGGRRSRAARAASAMADVEPNRRSRSPDSMGPARTSSR